MSLLSKYQGKLHHWSAKRKRRSMDLGAERCRSLAFLESRFGADGPALLEEYRRSEFRRWFVGRKAALRHTSGTSSEFDCETVYLLVRAARPELVVETGVLFGAFSSHVLEALRRNARGRLHSVDLPNDAPAQLDQPHDSLVREEAKDRWELTIGDVRDALPRLLARLEAIDLFLHDSDHRFGHQRWEYEIAFPRLRPGGALASHDVLSTLFRRSAFPGFRRDRGLDGETFYNLGIAVKPGG